MVTATPVLPSTIEIDKNIFKGLAASAHASRRILLNNSVIKEKATFNISVGFSSRDEPKLADNASEKATTLIEKMQLSKHFGTSTKLLFNG